MSATAISPFRKHQEISILPGESSAIGPLLDLAILQANAQGVYVYRFDRETSGATLAAFSGPAPDGRSAAIGALHRNRKTPLVLHADAAADWRFAGFPEFRTGRFQGVVSVPLLDSGEVVGLVNFCRSGDAPLSATALAFLMSLSLPLGALLVASTLVERLRQANQDLADRKLVERAKGMLQARFQWTEEEAYLRIRRSSRRRRIPMREIAREVIESNATLPEAFA
jgi:GAF domain-containing protein